MRRNLRSLLVAGAVGVPTAALLAGCGGGLPADAIAKVGDDTVSKATYDRTVTYVNALSNGPQAFTAKTASVIDFRPPYKACIAAIRKTTPKPAKGQPPVTDAQISPVCKQTWTGIQQQSAASPIREHIVDAEAKDDKITVSSAEITKALPDYLTQVIGGQANLAKFEKATGLTVEPFRDDLRSQLLFKKIQAKVAKDAGTPSAAQVQAAYEKAKYQAPLGSPETRDLHVVVTKTEARAKAAKQRLDGGASFKSVADQYSIDTTTKAQGGKLAGVAKGQQERGLETAAFGAKQGQIVGPVQTESGWYVVRVDKINAAKTTPFAKAQGQLASQLKQTRQQNAQTKWEADTIKKWKKRTDCRKGYIVEFCGNAPKPKATTQAAPAGAAGAASSGSATGDPSAAGAAGATSGN